MSAPWRNALFLRNTTVALLCVATLVTGHGHTATCGHAAIRGRKRQIASDLIKNRERLSLLDSEEWREGHDAEGKTGEGGRQAAIGMVSPRLRGWADHGRGARVLTEEKLPDATAFPSPSTRTRVGNRPRRLQITTDPVPIRIHVEYRLEDSPLHASEIFPVSKIREELIPTAIAVLHEAIRVKYPTAGRLRLPRVCTSVAEDDSGLSYCEEAQPGLDLASSPIKYRTCGGLEGDALHNLDLFDGFTTFREGEGGQLESQYLPPGPGVEADFVLYVMAKDMDCSGSVGWSVFCALDGSTGRPLAGEINLCPRALEKVQYHEILETAVHEMLHTLAFDDDLFALFLDDNGFRLPPESVVRTHPDSGVLEVVMPQTVRAFAEHLGCADVQGVPLENSGSRGTALEHWEQRILEGELMDPSAGKAKTSRPHVWSNITMAFLDDTGWYLTNRTLAGHLHWGFQAGCGFVDQSCTAFAQSNPQQDWFCEQQAVERGDVPVRCTADGSAFGTCSAEDWLMDGCMAVIALSYGSCRPTPSRIRTLGVADHEEALPYLQLGMSWTALSHCALIRVPIELADGDDTASTEVDAAVGGRLPPQRLGTADSTPVPEADAKAGDRHRHRLRRALRQETTAAAAVALREPAETAEPSGPADAPVDPEVGCFEFECVQGTVQLRIGQLQAACEWRAVPPQPAPPAPPLGAGVQDGGGGGAYSQLEMPQPPPSALYVDLGKAFPQRFRSGVLQCPAWDAVCGLPGSCPGMCNAQGDCFQGVCKCWLGFTGKDCSQAL